MRPPRTWDWHGLSWLDRFWDLLVRGCIPSIRHRKRQTLGSSIRTNAWLRRSGGEEFSHGPFVPLFCRSRKPTTIAAGTNPGGFTCSASPCYRITVSLEQRVVPTQRCFRQGPRAGLPRGTRCASHSQLFRALPAARENVDFPVQPPPPWSRDALHIVDIHQAAGARVAS